MGQAKRDFDPASDVAQSAYATARKACVKQAENEFVKRGGDAKEFAKAKEAAKKDSVRNTLPACIEEKIKAKKKDNANYEMSDADGQTFAEECSGFAKQKFFEAGGTEADFEKVKQEAAADEAADILEECIQNDNAVKAAGTDTVKLRAAYQSAFKSCSSEGEKAFKSAGGRIATTTVGGAKDFTFQTQMAQKRTKAIGDAMLKCIEKDSAYASVKSKTGATDAEINEAARKASKLCNDNAEMEFIKLGGDAKEFAEKKMEAKVNGVKDAMSACVKNKKDEVQGTVDDAKIKAFQKSCEVNARKEFARNGGKLDDFEMVRKQAARKEVTAKMDSCVEAQLAKYTSLSDEDTKKTAIEEAVKKCDAESETAFLEAGGKKEQYFVEKSKAQKEKIASVLETCIADKKKSDQSKTAKKAALECDSAAKDAFLKAGGSEAKFAKEKKEATVAGLRDGLKGCVDEKEIEAESGGTTLNEAKMKEIVKACEKRAEEKFQEVGGDIKQFKVAKAQAARKQLMEKGQVCIEKYMEDNSITSPTAANYAAARKFCKDEKRKEFVKSGGDATLFVLEEEKASEEAMDNILDATIENDEDVKNATTASERKAAFTAAYTKKKNDIKSAFLQQGGDEEDFERKQLESQRKATGKSLRACMESEIGKLQKTNPSETEMKSAYATCKPAAVEEIVKRGGKEEDFDRAAAVAAQETAGEEISACMDIDVATATKEDAENKIAECKPAAKEAMNMVVGRANDGGGRRLLDTNGRVLATASIDLDTDTALEDATKSAVANVLNRCQKDAGSDAAALAKCSLEAEMVYKKFGGDTDKREKSQKDGAAKMATLDRVACKKTGATDCEAKALKIYKQSGGDDDVNKASADANADKKMKADFK